MLSINRALWGTALDPIIAIDGQAGSGKSTTATAISSHFDIPHLNTGLFYRTATYMLIREGVREETDIEDCVELLSNLEVDVHGGRVFILGNEISKYLREPDVQQLLPTVSANKEVRRILLSWQRGWIERKGPSVVEGRDIGTVVFPHAFFKTYFTASDEARMRRRPEENTALLERDRIDATRNLAPATPAKDSHILDTTNLTSTEVADRVIGLVEIRLHNLLENKNIIDRAEHS